MFISAIVALTKTVMSIVWLRSSWIPEGKGIFSVDSVHNPDWLAALLLLEIWQPLCEAVYQAPLSHKSFHRNVITETHTAHYGRCLPGGFASFSAHTYSKPSFQIIMQSSNFYSDFPHEAQVKVSCWSTHWNTALIAHHCPSLLLTTCLQRSSKTLHFPQHRYCALR